MDIPFSMIETYLTDLNYDISINGNRNAMLEDISLYNPQSKSCNPSILYFCFAEVAIDNINNDCCYVIVTPHAEILPDNYILITHPEPLCLYEQLNSLFNKFNSWERKLLKSVSEFCSISTLMELSAEIFHNPITAYDNSMQLIGTFGVDEHLKELFWTQIEDSWYISQTTLAFSQATDLPLLEKNPTNAFIVDGFELNLHDWDIPNILECPIFNKNRKLGFLTIPMINKKLNESYFHLVETLAFYMGQVIEREMYSSDEYMCNSLFPIEIILGKDTNPYLINHYMNIMGWKESDNFQILIFNCSNRLDNNLAQKRIHYKYAINRIFEDNISTVINGNYVVILHNKLLTKESNSLKLLKLFASQNNLKVGCSMLFSNFEKAHIYYTQSLEVLNFSHKIINFYEGHLHDDIISIFNQYRDAVECIHPLIQKLSKEDNDCILRETLMQYLINDRSYAESTKALCVHKSTLKYRLDRIKDILQDEEYLSSDIRLDILLSLKISLKASKQKQSD